jgi:hypothetical protein
LHRIRAHWRVPSKYSPQTNALFFSTPNAIVSVHHCAVDSAASHLSRNACADRHTIATAEFSSAAVSGTHGDAIAIANCGSVFS